MEIRQDKLEHVLNLSESKYQDLYDNSPDMHVSVDAETIDVKSKIQKGSSFTVKFPVPVN